MCVQKYFCFCVPIAVSIKMNGILSIVKDLIIIALLIMNLTKNHSTIDNNEISMSIAIIIMVIADILLSMLLMQSIKSGKRVYLLPWLFLSMVQITHYVAITVYAILEHTIMFDDIRNNPWIFVAAVVAIIYYFYTCVFIMSLFINMDYHFRRFEQIYPEEFLNMLNNQNSNGNNRNDVAIVNNLRTAGEALLHYSEAQPETETAAAAASASVSVF